MPSRFGGYKLTQSVIPVGFLSMDMNLQEWLVVAGLVIIFGIVIDGYRRMRREKRDSMEVSMGMGGGFENTPLDNATSPELPNGGARIVRPAISPELEKPAIYKGHRERPGAADKNVPAKTYTAQDDSGAADSKVRVARSGNIKNSAAAYARLSVRGAGDVVDDLGDDLGDDRAWGSASDEGVADYGAIDESVADWDNEPSPDWSDAVLDDREPSPPSEQSAKASAGETARNPVVNDRAEGAVGFGKKIGGLFSGKSFPGWSKQEPVEKPADRKSPSEVVVINVISKSPRGFKGQDLRILFEACGMEHGEMSIFHRHEEASNSSPIQFSVANAVEPGYFDVEQIDTLTTPGVSFFIALPGPANSMQAFDYMVETAQCVVRNLGGELRDENRSAMTPQTIEHFRERVREFERKRLSFGK
jgi:cell division protein ZipA